MTLSRIAYVLNVFPKLSETFIAGELSELGRRGVGLRILSLRQPTETVRHAIVSRAGLDALTCYEPGKFATLLREFGPELVHAHFATEPAAAARELAEGLGVPFTFTAHGYDIRRKPPPDFGERAAAARAVITVSRANAGYIAETFGVPMDHLHVIPCGVDTSRFRSARVAGATGKNTPMIVCVARHAQVKNLRLLLETCALLRDRGVAFRCVQIGDGPLRGKLEELRRRLGLDAHVEFTGALEQTEVLGWLQRASVAVLTSESEGMPVSLMEAAACGVPAVATAVGGVSELVVDGVTGLLASPNDAAGLAEALHRLLSDPSLAGRMGTAARRRAEEEFSVKRQVNSLLAIWSEVLERELVR